MKIDKYLTVFIFLGYFFIFLHCDKGVEPETNSAPVISSIIPSRTHVNFSDSISVQVVAYDADDDSLRYKWFATNGYLYYVNQPTVNWTAPDTADIVSIGVKVSDGNGGYAKDSIKIFVANQKPEISNLYIEKTNVILGNTITVKCTASDPDGDDITIRWSATDGTFSKTEGDSSKWTAPNTSKTVVITVTVSDEHNAQITRETEINVYQELGSVWISDTFNDEVVKLSSIGSELVRVTGFSRPQGIAINVDERNIYVADNGNNRIVKMSNEGMILKTKNIIGPRDVDVHYFTGDVWIVHSGDSTQITRLSSDFSKTKSIIKGLKNPQAVSINQVTGDVWVADTENNRVIRFYGNVPALYNVEKTKPDSVYHQVFSDFLNPIDLSVNSSTGNCWVSDRDNDRIVRLSKGGGENIYIYGFSAPQSISVNKKDGSCWVADKENNLIIKLRPEITQVSGINIQDKLGFHIAVSGFLTPWAVAVNNEDSSCWASESSKILKISEDGEVLEEILGFNLAKSIVVNP